MRTTSETSEEAATPFVFRPRAPTPAAAQGEAVQDREDEDAASAGEVCVFVSFVSDILWVCGSVDLSRYIGAFTENKHVTNSRCSANTKTFANFTPG